jgi:ATPase subunit of ABC transporter with duplicated ATPase domains
LAGGERKRLVLDVVLRSDGDVLLLDEPDNFLDVAAKLELERAIRESRKTILMVSHDREVLAGAVTQIVTVEGNGAWVHGSGYASYPEARRARQERMGDAVKRWHEEEKRLRDFGEWVGPRWAPSPVTASPPPRRPFGVLSGGQKARLEVLVLVLAGHNLLLLDEPTDDLDIDSSQALEAALHSFTGTAVAVSHDRAFLRAMDRY